MNINFMAPLLLVGVIVAFFVFMVSAVIHRQTPPYSLGTEAIQLIEDCEASLPRDKHCALRAEPKE